MVDFSYTDIAWFIIIMVLFGAIDFVLMCLYSDINIGCDTKVCGLSKSLQCFLKHRFRIDHID
jgi:hypothetical protein